MKQSTLNNILHGIALAEKFLSLLYSRRASEQSVDVTVLLTFCNNCKIHCQEAHTKLYVAGLYITDYRASYIATGAWKYLKFLQLAKHPHMFSYTVGSTQLLPYICYLKLFLETSLVGSRSYLTHSANFCSQVLYVKCCFSTSDKLIQSIMNEYVLRLSKIIINMHIT